MRINAKHIVVAVLVPHCVNGWAHCRLCRSGAARASDSRMFGSGAAPISGSRNCQTPGICRSGARACRGLRTRGPRHRKMPRLLFALRFFPCFDDLSACQPTEFAYIDVAGNASGSLHAMRIELVTGTATKTGTPLRSSERGTAKRIYLRTSAFPDLLFLSYSANSLRELCASASPPSAAKLRSSLCGQALDGPPLRIAGPGRRQH